MSRRSVPALLVAFSFLSAGCAGARSAQAGGDTGAARSRALPERSASGALLPNARLVEAGTIVVGGQPSGSQLEGLSRDGFGTLISLQTDAEPGVAETLDRAKALGMKVVHLPIAGAQGLTLDAARALSQALAEREGKVALHCRSGNRAAALLGLARFVEGAKSAVEAMALAEAAGLRSEGLRARLQELVQGSTEASGSE